MLLDIFYIERCVLVALNVIDDFSFVPPNSSEQFSLQTTISHWRKVTHRITMISQLLPLSLLLSSSFALSVPRIHVRQQAQNPTTGSSANPYNTCGPYAHADDALTPHQCTNDVRVADQPDYYSAYLDSNPYFSYDTSNASSDLTGTVSDNTYIIPSDWILQCNVEDICSGFTSSSNLTNVTLGGWYTDLTSPNCLMAFYIPDATESFDNGTIQASPTRDVCIHQIMGPLINQLAANISSQSAQPTQENPLVNRASINVVEDGFPAFVYGVGDEEGVDNFGIPAIPGWSRWLVQGWPTQNQ